MKACLLDFILCGSQQLSKLGFNSALHFVTPTFNEHEMKLARQGVYHIIFVLVSQPTFGQQAQAKLLGLREFSCWEGACNAKAVLQPKLLTFQFAFRSV